MSGTLGADLAAPLREPFRLHAQALLERHGEACSRLDPAIRTGLARLLASNGEAAGFLARRTRLFERLGELGTGWPARRAKELAELAEAPVRDDLEALLDELRLLRREDTVLSACLDLSGVVDFEEISFLLSRLAECVLERALRAARKQGSEAPLAVLGMGKLAGREFTYESDLDLVFLGELPELEPATRLAQRLLAYLSTMTGAGVAYRVDTRLRPSGQKGTLVTTYEGWEHHQLEVAETWEHLALLRSRAVAGEVARAGASLDRARRAVVERDRKPWETVRELRRRVQEERAREAPGRVAFKAGRGGIMDVEFLAAGSVLERGHELPDFPPPAVPAMLRATVPGAPADDVLAAYRLLRRVEARARFVAGRPVEHLEANDDRLPVVAELVEPGLGVEALHARIASARDRVGDAVDRVLDRGSVSALGRG